VYVKTKGGIFKEKIGDFKKKGAILNKKWEI
jgi:hypothetical protein